MRRRQLGVDHAQHVVDEVVQLERLPRRLVLVQSVRKRRTHFARAVVAARMLARISRTRSRRGDGLSNSISAASALLHRAERLVGSRARSRGQLADGGEPRGVRELDAHALRLER
jgi:hypothetical protein